MKFQNRTPSIQYAYPPFKLGHSTIKRDSKTSNSVMKLPRIKEDKKQNQNISLCQNDVQVQYYIKKTKSEAVIDSKQKQRKGLGVKKYTKSSLKIEKKENDRKQINQQSIEPQITSFGYLNFPKTSQNQWKVFRSALDCLKKSSHEYQQNFEDWTNEKQKMTIGYMKKSSRLQQQNLQLQIEKLSYQLK